MFDWSGIDVPTADGDLVTSLYNFAAALVQYALDLATNNIGLLTFGAFMVMGFFIWKFIIQKATGEKRGYGNMRRTMNGFTVNQAKIGDGLAMMGYSSNEISKIIKGK